MDDYFSRQKTILELFSLLHTDQQQYSFTSQGRCHLEPNIHSSLQVL